MIPLGYVPMFRYSLFAQHFMPTLLLLAPLSRLFDSPAYLIVLQTLFYAVAGFLLFRLAERHVPRQWALALLAAFLLSRTLARSSHELLLHRERGADAYLRRDTRLVKRSKAPVLDTHGARHGCKEDVAIYFLGFGAMLAVTRRDRRTAVVTMALASVWFVVALFVAIPYWRNLYELGVGSPFLEGRYALEEGGLLALIGRLFSLQSLGKIVTVTSSTAFLCFLSPRWMAVALPGLPSIWRPFRTRAKLL